jgi:hypothetical protein
MKMIFKPRKHPYLARVGILLIAVALIVGTLSCVPTPTTKYSLTMAVSPAGSGTAQDVTGASPYAANTKVDVKATALGSYNFVKWTSSDGGTFDNPNLATTKFTMPAQNVTATANFVGPLDHFKCYPVSQASPLGMNVHLKDQFVDIDATVGVAVAFGNPTEKVYAQNTTNISNPDHHFTAYNISYQGEPGTWYVEVTNQFNSGEPQYLTVWGPVGLAVPTQELEPGNHQPPLSLDHYLLYEVIGGPLMNVGVSLSDEFGPDTCNVGYAVAFANPVQKTLGTTVTPIQHPAEHLVFYDISGCQATCPQVQVVNQLKAQTQTLSLGYPAFALAVPSKKVDFGEQIDHFTCYPLTLGTPINEVVHLKDQFVDTDANVGLAFSFCNPASKQDIMGFWPILNPDYHLTMYLLGVGGGPQYWSVQVQNQFGIQDLTVSGPYYLAVPTQKVDPGNHAPPVGLDHYLLYEVIGGSQLQITVSLTDEFGTDSDVLVLEPYMFANPVQKTVDSVVTPIENSMAHLVFYKISGDMVYYPQVQVINQFVAPTYYSLTDPANMLAVPSLKLFAELAP